MANISELEQYDESVPEVAVDQPVAGGVSGPVNLLGKALANRTKWLKAQAGILSSAVAALEALIGTTNMDDVLKKAQNLSDVPDKAAARINLGVAASEHNHDSNYLNKTANLSDVDNANTARGNLGVSDFHFVNSPPGAELGKNGDIAVQEITNATPIMYKRQSNIWVPVVNSQNTEIPGVFKWFTGATVPNGYLKCNGQAVNRSTYAALFAAISTRYGLGNGSTTFNIPDVRGNAIRGYDEGRGIDTGRALGSEQDSQNKGHVHALSGGLAVAAGGHSHTASTGAAGTHGHSASADAGGSHSHSAACGYIGGDGYPGFTWDNSGGVGFTQYTNIGGLHSHGINITAVGNHTHSVSVAAVGDHSHSLGGNTQAEGGTEARMRNIAFIGIIKY